MSPCSNAQSIIPEAILWGKGIASLPYINVITRTLSNGEAGVYQDSFKSSMVFWM